jgi:hypothetical protein
LLIWEYTMLSGKVNLRCISVLGLCTCVWSWSDEEGINICILYLILYCSLLCFSGILTVCDNSNSWNICCIFHKGHHSDGQQSGPKHVRCVTDKKMHCATSWYRSVVKKTRLVFNFFMHGSWKMYYLNRKR